MKLVQHEIWLTKDQDARLRDLERSSGAPVDVIIRVMVQIELDRLKKTKRKDRQRMVR